MPYHVICKGKYTVAAHTEVTESWEIRCPVTDFLHQQSMNGNTAGACSGYMAMFARVAELGPQSLTSAMTHEANKQNAILEFIKGPLRVLYFIEKDLVILTNGYLKNGQKADPKAVAEAISIRDSYVNSQGKKK